MAVLMVLLMAAPGVAYAQKQISLLATLTHPAGEPILTLEPAGVRVLENGAAAKVLKVEAVNRAPKLHLLIDNGVGLGGGALADLRKGLHGLVDALPEGVLVSVVTTSPQPRSIERGTTDRAKLHRAVDLVVSSSGGAGRFVESLLEATERIAKDKDSNNVIVSLASTSGDTLVRDGDTLKIMNGVFTTNTRVHVVLFMASANTSLGGDIQILLGERVTKETGGRYERINVASRLATVLPEVGAEAAKTLGAGAKQFRITAERPAGASGEFGRVSMAAGSLIVSEVILEAD